MKDYDSLFLKGRSPAVGLLFVLLLLAPATLLARNLVENPGFESGLKGWGGPGAGGTIEATREPVHSGRQAARVSNRTAPGQGISQLIRSAPASGGLYQYSAWVKIENANLAPVSMVLKKVDESNGGNPSSYTVVQARAFSREWTQLRGTFRLHVTGRLSQLDLGFQGPPAGVNLLVDDVAIQPFTVLPYYWPGFGLLTALGGVFLYGFVTRRYPLAGLSGTGFVALFALLVWSAYSVLQVEMRRMRPMDWSQHFKAFGFENVINGHTLEIKENVDVPTLYQGAGVRLYATCTTNLAIAASVAEIYGRVEGKLYFRGRKLTIMPNAEVVNGLDAQGTVYRLGKVGGPITGDYRLFNQIPISQPRSPTNFFELEQ